MGGGIQAASHDTGDFANTKPQQHTGDDPTEGKAAEGGKNKQSYNKTGSAGLFIAVGVLLAHVHNSLPKYQKNYITPIL